MPTGRWELSTFVVDGKIYAIGGAGPVYQALRTVEVYDPTTDTWTTKSEMPTARQCLSTSVVNGKIYAIGGGAAFSTSYTPLEVFSTVEEYDPATDTWTTKSEMPTARACHHASVVDGRIYVIGGSDASTPDDRSHIRPVEVYDPATDTWTQEGYMRGSRAAGFSSVVDGKIYLIGGYGGSQRVYEYDPSGEHARNHQHAERPGLPPTCPRGRSGDSGEKNACAFPLLSRPEPSTSAAALHRRL